MSMDRSQRFWDQSRGRRRCERRDPQKPLRKKKELNKKCSLATSNIVRATAVNIWENLTDKEMTVIQGMHEKLSNSSTLGVIEIIDSVTEVVGNVCGPDMVNETFYLINENKSHAAYQLAIELLGIYKNKKELSQARSLKELHSKSTAGLELKKDDGSAVWTSSEMKIHDDVLPARRVAKGSSKALKNMGDLHPRKRISRSPEYLSCLDLPMEPKLSKHSPSPESSEKPSTVSVKPPSQQKHSTDLAVFTLLTDVCSVGTPGGSQPGSIIANSTRTSISSTSTINGHEELKRPHKENKQKMKSIKELDVTTDAPQKVGEGTRRSSPRNHLPLEVDGHTSSSSAVPPSQRRSKGENNDQNAVVTPIFRAKRENIEKEAQELGVYLEKEGFVTERSLVASLKESIIGKHKVKMYKKKMARIHERIRNENLSRQKDVRIVPIKPPVHSKNSTPANRNQERELIPAVIKTPNWTQPTSIARNEALLKKRDILRMKNSERNNLVQKQFLRLKPIKMSDSSEPRELKKNPSHGRKAKVKIRPESSGLTTSESLATEEVIQLIKENAPGELAPFLEIIKCYNDVKQPISSSSETGSSSKLAGSFSRHGDEPRPDDSNEKHVSWSNQQFTVQVCDSAQEFATFASNNFEDQKKNEKKLKKAKSLEKKLEGARVRRRKHGIPSGSFEIIAITLLVLGLGAFFVSEAPLLGFFSAGEPIGFFGQVNDALNSFISSILFPFF